MMYHENPISPMNIEFFQRPINNLVCDGLVRLLEMSRTTFPSHRAATIANNQRQGLFRDFPVQEEDTAFEQAPKTRFW